MSKILGKGGVRGSFNKRDSERFNCGFIRKCIVTYPLTKAHKI